MFSLDTQISLVIISGRSGAGKSVALRVLEDLGYYCIDNLPVSFLTQLLKDAKDKYPKLAISIDIRNMPHNAKSLESIHNEIKNNQKINSTIIYIDAA